MTSKFLSPRITSPTELLQLTTRMSSPISSILSGPFRLWPNQSNSTLRTEVIISIACVGKFCRSSEYVVLQWKEVAQAMKGIYLEQHCEKSAILCCISSQCLQPADSPRRTAQPLRGCPSDSGTLESKSL